VTRSQPQIHDSPRNQLILEVSAMGRRVHVSVNKALAVCDGFSKLLKTLRQRAQGKVRQRDAGQDIYFARRNRCMIALLLANFGKEATVEPITGNFSQETLAEIPSGCKKRRPPRHPVKKQLGPCEKDPR
jgi:hypothetical protein